MTLFVNALTHIDVSYWSPRDGLVGASWHVDVELDGQLGEDGMLFDFGEVKPWIKSRLDAGADHTLLVPTRAAGVSVFECGKGLCIHAQAPYDVKICGPRQAFTLLPWAEITAEGLAKHFAVDLLRSPPPRISDIRLKLREEVIEDEAYRYSHGLKHHTGNCQRIAHGHRSKLYIWSNGQRNPALEAKWASWLDGRYFVDEADIVPASDDETLAMLTCRYQAPQGRFCIRLPKERCAVLSSPTTIENIATWLAQKVARDSGEATRICAFEGIDKGAMAESLP